MTSNPTFDNSAKIHMNTTRDILFADPMVLAKWITQQYYDEIPCNINNCEDLAIAGDKQLFLSYSRIDVCKSNGQGIETSSRKKTKIQ